MCYSFHCICKNKEKFTSFPTLFYQCTYVAFANLKVATGGGEKKVECSSSKQSVHYFTSFSRLKLFSLY